MRYLDGGGADVVEDCVPEVARRVLGLGQREGAGSQRLPHGGLRVDDLSQDLPVMRRQHKSWRMPQLQARACVVVGRAMLAEHVHASMLSVLPVACCRQPQMVRNLQHTPEAHGEGIRLFLQEGVALRRPGQARLHDC